VKPFERITGIAKDKQEWKNNTDKKRNLGQRSPNINQQSLDFNAAKIRFQ